MLVFSPGYPLHLMAKYKPHFWFIGLMSFYFFVRYIRVNVEGMPDFIRFYLTDLIFVPTMCCFALIFVRILKRDTTITISPVLVLMQTLFVSIYFEWYLPTYKGRIGWYTSDPWDIVMYFCGAFLFLVIQRYSISPRL